MENWFTFSKGKMNGISMSGCLVFVRDHENCMRLRDALFKPKRPLQTLVTPDSPFPYALFYFLNSRPSIVSHRIFIIFQHQTALLIN